MEININCDLGEKSKHHSNKYDPDLLEIVNSANVACGYHAGDEETMNQVVKISKNNGVSIGAHPSFKDPENFGRERMNLSESEIKKRKPHKLTSNQKQMLFKWGYPYVFDEFKFHLTLTSKLNVVEIDDVFRSLQNILKQVNLNKISFNNICIFGQKSDEKFYFVQRFNFNNLTH